MKTIKETAKFTEIKAKDKVPETRHSDLQLKIIIDVNLKMVNLVALNDWTSPTTIVPKSVRIL